MIDDEDAAPYWEFPAALAEQPQSWQWLLNTHVSGPDGRCRGCRSQVTAAPRWPCTLYRAAARARRIAAERTTRPGDRPPSGR